MSTYVDSWNIIILELPTSLDTSPNGGLFVCVSVCVSVCPRTCRHIHSAHDEWLIMKLCMYVGYHTANNVSHFGGDPVTQINLKKV